MADETLFDETLPDVFGAVIFCDDLRIEITHKIMAIGIYNTAMQVGGPFPFALRSFAMLITYSERIGTQKDPVTIEVLFPGSNEPVATIPLGADFREKIANPNISNPKFYNLMVPVTTPPATFAEPGTVRVIARVGDRVHRLGLLRVEAVTPPSPPQMPPNTRDAARES